MKKSIKNTSNAQGATNTDSAIGIDANNAVENQEIIYDEQIENNINSDSEESSDFSFSSIIRYGFIIMLIIAVTYKFVFPTIDSIEANLTHKKIGKSIVSSYFNLLQNTKYSEALKLLDTNSSPYSIDSMINNLKTEFGSTDIVGCNVLDVIEDKDSSIVNTIVSYVDNTGNVLKKDQSFMVKNTPQGWKISLNGLVKKFKLQPTAATYSDSFIISLEEIEYCVEGINLKVNIKNESYKKFNINGKINLNMRTGYSFSEPIQSVLKPKVSYEHNILFSGSNGDPYEVVINLDDKKYQTCTLPVKIIR